MLPDFGYALYVEFSDRSRALVAWASDRQPLHDNALTFVRPFSEEVASWHIVAAHRVSVVHDGDLPYDLMISDLEPQQEVYADPYAPLPLRSCS